MAMYVICHCHFLLPPSTINLVDADHPLDDPYWVCQSLVFFLTAQIKIQILNHEHQQTNIPLPSIFKFVYVLWLVF